MTNLKQRDRDERIVWQNQSHLALEILKSKLNDEFSVFDLARVTDALTSWCVYGRTEDNIKKLQAIDSHLEALTMKKEYGL